MITHLKLSVKTTIRGLKAGADLIGLGDPGDNAWGGGKIVSIEETRGGGFLVRKDCPFIRSVEAERKSQPAFDAVLIPAPQVACACVKLDEQGKK